MVEPLRKRTMTLEQLQTRTLTVLKRLKRQMRMPHQTGISDEEVIEHIIEPLETDIRQDRVILKTKEQG